MTKLTPSRSMSSRRQLVLESIRRHFRAVGASPSHGEIAQATGMKRQHVGRWLDELQDAGLICYSPGRARSIVLVDRAANLSDCELQLACAGRGWAVSKPAPVVQPIASAFSVDTTVAAFTTDLIAELEKYPGTS
ncbi:LexA family protein [Sphingomonas sp. Leaf4]|uniref:LexA family protein n=1 Tax=Sphingomonas sp. Leaf4 TaxID=2876553 RepID=UPI001E441335|nr:helix-turn-helix domain-containing protein [Sphingomonas sp. Leaf4]